MIAHTLRFDFKVPHDLQVATVFFTPSGKNTKLKSSRLDTVFGDTVFGKIITHPGIQYRQQFAHTCRNGNLIRLTLGQQALVEIPNKRFKTCRYHGSHIQRLTHRRPSAQAAAFEFGFPALPGMWGQYRPNSLSVCATDVPIRAASPSA